MPIIDYICENLGIMRKSLNWIIALACLVAGVWSCGTRHRGQQENWYTNPICEGMDNDIFYQYEGKYYVAQDRGGNIYVQAFDDPADASFDQMKLAVEMRKNYGLTHIWYPQITRIDGKWYIYVTADDGNTDNHKMYVLVNENEDPMEGTFQMAGRLKTDENDNWAIHGHVFQYRGRLYMIWSGWQSKRVYAERQNIYISEMASPTELSGKRVMISTPEYEWEQQWIQRDGGSTVRYPVFVNERPSFFTDDKTDRIYVFYSASAHWTAYCCIGELYADKDADLLDSGSWSKIPHPVFSENREAGIYGPSAPVLVKSPDGECTYLMYSAAVTEKSPHSRSIYMQPISFSAEGNPEFGKPVPRNVRLPRVSSGNPRI